MNGVQALAAVSALWLCCIEQMGESWGLLWSVTALGAHPQPQG